MAAFTRWVLTHKLLIALFWLLITIVGGISSSSAVNALSQTFDLPGSKAYAANAAILRMYGNGADANPIVPVIRFPAGTTVDSPGVRAKLAASFARAAATLGTARVVSYANTGSRSFVSKDGRTTFGLIYLPRILAFSALTVDQAKVERALSGTTINGARFHVTGVDILAAGNSGGGSGPSLLAEALLGGFGALLVLIFVFRSFMALVPLVMAAAAIPTTFLLVWALTAVTDVSFIVQFLVALIGLGVAIDYSLIVVLRWREERAKGVPNEVAVETAMATAGRAVVFSGTTVAIGLLALIVLPVPFLRSMGIGGMLIPLVSVLVALTLLPVVLASVGPRLDWPRFRGGGDESRFWHWWSALVVRHRRISAALGILILAVLGGAASTIALGQSKADSLAKSGEAYVGLKTLERSGFPVGVLSPIDVLVQRGDPQRTAARLGSVQGVQSTVAPDEPSWRRAGSALVAVLPVNDASSRDGRSTVNRVRDAVRDLPGAVQVGGGAPLTTDFISAVYGSFPLMLTIIAIVTFLLLTRAFRSLLLPFKAVLLNVLSVAAAWGVLVLVWQYGYGSELIWGIQSTGAITFWIPLMVFAFLFGLSMDYEVFILARVREEYDRYGSTNTAVVAGIGWTGRLVTSAALILFFAFVALASGPGTDIKVIGTGLGAGILLDATVVRMLLVPALVSLFGRWNWWLPSLPARLLRVEPSRGVREPVTAKA